MAALIIGIGGALAYRMGGAPPSPVWLESAREVVISAAAGPVRFTAEVADSDVERERGLMFRPSLPMESAMLFIFSADTATPFWMKNTLIPLDLIFIDRHLRVVAIIPSATPGSEVPLFPGSPYRYVLEINGGLASRFGIRVGDPVQF